MRWQIKRVSSQIQSLGSHTLRMGDIIYKYDVINRVCAMTYKQWCVFSKCGCDVKCLWCHTGSGCDLISTQVVMSSIKCFFFFQTVQNLLIFWSKYCMVISDGVILSLFSLLVLILQLQIQSLESYAVSIRDSQIQDRWLQRLAVTLQCHV